MRRKHFCTLLASLAATPLAVFAESYTAPVGVVHVTVQPGSDALLAVPLNRESVFQGTVSSITGNKITVSPAPAWPKNILAPLKTANQTFAVQLASGAKEGMVAKISANTADSLEVILDPGNSLAGIVAGDLIDIMPCWTPASLFGKTLASGTRRLLFPTTAAGINKGASVVLQFNGTDWINLANKAKSSHLTLKFGDAFVLRNAAKTPQTVAMSGYVPMTMHRTIIRTLAASTAQDQRIGYMSPVKEVLGDTGLGFANGDQLLAFDNAATGINKKPYTTLRYDGTAWIDSKTATDVTRSFTLLPGTGYIYRRAATPRPVVTVWSDLQSYLSP